MTTLQKVVPKTQRSKRALEHRAPKIHENIKSALVVKGPTTSDIINHLLTDLSTLKSPNTKVLQKRNQVRPFEDASSLEFLGNSNGCSLFFYGSHSKKRPHNLILGRMFDFQVTLMIEAEISNYKSMKSFASRKALVRKGSKPCFLFQGDFESDEQLTNLKNLLIDTFRGEILPKINLASVDHIIVVNSFNNCVQFRHYGILLKNSEERFPRVDLEEVGPSFDMKIGRMKEGDSSLIKESYKISKASKERVLDKNMEIGPFGEKHGRVHMQKQNLNDLQTRKLKGLKRSKVVDEEKSPKKAKLSV